MKITKAQQEQAGLHLTVDLDTGEWTFTQADDRDYELYCIQCDKHTEPVAGQLLIGRLANTLFVLALANDHPIEKGGTFVMGPVKPTFINRG